MSDYTEEELNAIWQKGRVIEGEDPNVYRLDVADGLMKKSLYGNEGNLGWEVDHIYPKERLKADKVPEDRWNDMVNLRPMNAKNNVAKGEGYPDYKRAVIWDRATNEAHKNKDVADGDSNCTVAIALQNAIAENYKKWIKISS